MCAAGGVSLGDRRTSLTGIEDLHQRGAGQLVIWPDDPVAAALHQISARTEVGTGR